MRQSSRSRRLHISDLHKIQRSVNDKIEKQVSSLGHLIDLPDFDVAEFFQTLMKSTKYEQVLAKIPRDKKVDFFSRNYVSFIETQEELANFKIPELEEIPKAKHYHFEEQTHEKAEENFEESAVVEIVDSFANSVLENDTQESMRILMMIKQMKQHSKYRQYFEIFSTSELLRESYATFIETCENQQTLKQLGEVSRAINNYLKDKNSNFLVTIRADLNIDRSPKAIKRAICKFTTFIEQTLSAAKTQFPPEIFNAVEAETVIPKWISELNVQFYETVEGIIYEKQEVSDLLQSLDCILEVCTDFETKGINLTRDFRSFISADVPIHMNKIIEVVVEAFEDLMKGNQLLYEFKFLDGFSDFSELDDKLIPVNMSDYGRQCCSQKGILLINSFVIILEPLSSKKWLFLLQSVIQNLLRKVSLTIMNSNWPYWDYYQLFHFFQRLANGKVKNKRLFETSNHASGKLREKITQINNLSINCWENFEAQLTNQYWNQILSKIPDLLWEVRPYYQSKSDSPAGKPTVFSIDILFKVQEFMNMILYRLEKTQMQRVLTFFYHYILYVIEYVLYWDYHKSGSKDKIFELYKSSQKIYKRAKLFAVEDLDTLKYEKKITKIAIFTHIGVQNFALDMHFFTQALKMQTEDEKLSCDSFVKKVCKIECQEHKTEPIELNNAKLGADLQKYVSIFKSQPEKFRQYLESKRSEVRKTRK